MTEQYYKKVSEVSEEEIDNEYMSYKNNGKCDEHITYKTEVYDSFGTAYTATYCAVCGQFIGLL